MGNSAWVARQIPKQTQEVVELGAGEGRLAALLRRGGARVVALDLTPAPANLPEGVLWKQGDFFTTLPQVQAQTVVASLVLHHFSTAQLRQLGRLLQERKRLIFVEPLRCGMPLFCALLASPLCGRVTRHDMPASIRAGFLPGELGAALELGPQWQIAESIGRFGALRFQAWRET